MSLSTSSLATDHSATTTKTAAAATPPTTPCISEALCLSLIQRGRALLAELAATQQAYAAAPGARSHGALAFAAAQAQQLLRLTDGARARLRQERREAPPHTALSSSPSPATLAAMEQQRLDLRRALPRALAALEEPNGSSSGNGSSSSSTSAAADAAASLRALMHTRSLLSLELRKVKAAARQLSGAADAVDGLQQTLGDVHGAMEQAQLVVRRLLTVQSREDLVLRLSAAVFVAVVVFVLLQRVLRLFAAAVYVTVDVSS